MLSFYEVRLGCIADVHVETRSRHEMRLLRDYDASESALTRHRQALWLVDRAFIDAAFWNRKKKHAGITIITRMKSSLRVDSTEDRPVPEVPVNEGVVKDLRITLRSSRAPWRLITYHTRRGHQVEFLTNEFALAPGLIAFLSSRRWEEEKCFDTGKNDFSLAKAWGASPVAIANQARLAMVTSLLVALFVHRKMGPTALPMRRRCANRTSGKPPTPTEPTVPIGVPPSSATHPRSAAKCFGSSNTVSISQLPRRSMIATYGHYYWRTYDGEPDTVASRQFCRMLAMTARSARRASVIDRSRTSSRPTTAGDPRSVPESSTSSVFRKTAWVGNSSAPLAWRGPSSRAD